jgi:hypothetical protein
MEQKFIRISQLALACCMSSPPSPRLIIAGNTILSEQCKLNELKLFYSRQFRTQYRKDSYFFLPINTGLCGDEFKYGGLHGLEPLASLNWEF